MFPISSCNICCWCSNAGILPIEDAIIPSNELTIDDAAATDLVNALLKILKITKLETSQLICQNCHDQFRHFYDFLEKCIKAEKWQREIYVDRIKSEAEEDSAADEKMIEMIKMELDEMDSDDEVLLEDPLVGSSSSRPLRRSKRNANATRQLTGKRHNRRGSLKKPKRSKIREQMDSNERDTTTNLEMLQIEYMIEEDLKETVEDAKEEDDDDDDRTEAVAEETIEDDGTEAVAEEIIEDYETEAVAEDTIEGDGTEAVAEDTIEGDGISFKCDICNAELTSTASLDDHKRVQHDSDYRCSQCPSRFRYAQSLKIHEEVHAGVHYKCDQCNTNFSRPATLRAHRIKRHNYKPRTNTARKGQAIDKIRKRTVVPQIYPCNFCQQEYRSKQKLNAHIRSHGRGIAEVYVCKQCPAKFRFRFLLIAHERKKHDIGVKYYCDQCAGIFYSQSLLREHQRTHTGEKYVCEQCDWEFIREKELMVHRQVHEGDTFRCDQCGAKFGELKHFNAHKRLHTGEVFTCYQCPAKFLFAYLLKRHVKVHERESSSPEVDDATETETNQTTNIISEKLICSICEATYDSLQGLLAHVKTHEEFECSQCPMKFANRKELVSHQRIHSNRPLYGCNECGKKFAKQMDLQAHQRIHTGETLNCTECNAVFLRPDRLKEHMRIHTGDTFDCEHCGAKFAAMHMLRRHLIMHTEDKPYACELCGWKTRHKSGLAYHRKTHIKTGNVLKEAQ